MKAAANSTLRALLRALAGSDDRLVASWAAAIAKRGEFAPPAGPGREPDLPADGRRAAR
jgi:hypothetical protein